MWYVSYDREGGKSGDVVTGERLGRVRAHTKSHRDSNHAYRRGAESWAVRPENRDGCVLQLEVVSASRGSLG